MIEDVYKFNFVNERISNDTHDELLLISVVEACELTGIGRNTMLKLSKQKGFPGIISKHKIRIDKNQLVDWLKKNYSKYKN